LTAVSLSEVRLALRNTLGKRGMMECDTDRLAEYLMSFFGFNDHIIDNRLTSETRDVFYMLEEEGFLTTQHEEVHLEKGKLWRLNYWVLKTDQILRAANRENVSAEEPEEPSNIYGEVSDACWVRERQD
jgi:hypothetical protein